MAEALPAAAWAASTASSGRLPRATATTPIARLQTTATSWVRVTPRPGSSRKPAATVPTTAPVVLMP